jgi:hypothetical protein
MNTRGLMELVVLNIGLSVGVVALAVLYYGRNGAVHDTPHWVCAFPAVSSPHPCGSHRGDGRELRAR